ncbi:MAG: bacterial transcriptional activator domain-containing protein [Oscillospiraceae bacterium]|nr:bacterial transcriptional activator domain-containing protein [Oscillospiraceae bacterium]
MSDILNVSMLGSFTFEYRGNILDDSSNRMKKVWLVLAYLIFTRGSRVPMDSYASLLQSSSDDAGDSAGRLKAMFYRARTMLDQLENDAGHNFILRKNGTYAWNTDIPLTLDIDEFERFCAQASKTEDAAQRLELYLSALDLYKGDFLPRLSMEHWVMPISAYYHQMYLDAAYEALTLLESGGNWTRAAELCRKSLKIEPYSEEFYQHLMRCLIALGDRNAALRAYDDMSELLFSTFGVMPSDESRSLYREASRNVDSTAIPADSVSGQLKEPSAATGALFCEYDFFKLLYQVQARAIIRSGEVIHIALFSVHGKDKDLSRRSLDNIMDNLQEVIVTGLRQGDVVTRCSISQFILMLPQANYENSCMVCQRIIKTFFRKYPHSPADIHSSVHPLEPKTPEHTYLP